MKHPFRILRHACTMVGRNLRSYRMLSVTIILSFSLLLGYLVYTDTSLYNTYMSTFAGDRNVLVASAYTASNAKKMDLLIDKASEIGETHGFTVMKTLAYITNRSFYLDTGESVRLPSAMVYCLPSRCWALPCVSREPIRIEKIHWLDGQTHDEIHLSSGEAIIDDALFYALGLDQMETPTYNFYLNNGLNSDYAIRKAYTIVGTIHSESPITLDTETIPDAVSVVDYAPRLYLPLEDVNPELAPDWRWSKTALLYTDSPEAVDELMDTMGLKTVTATYEMQNDALARIRTKKQTKAIITGALLLLLGINLYSSFTNALNDRRFEIGVKRAVGASRWSIIRQFLYESVLVLAADILLSVALVTDAALIYKAVSPYHRDVLWAYCKRVLYCSSYSVAMFLICSITLTVVFSLIFAYKSTQVEIVEYLKAE